ncbi:ribonuclease Z [Paraliobacillus quinghaiensis]|uniref:Ribonuclease Z n=1 Tax=Paraliobacillus quinghaiensis TaxID=470815 RepID=A0A917TH93_9BACI|nr:ribonuclease Z [Paraliobacillus quinghaiensis]GGM22279.1 ribonuclease Z [Paraliobacillus quinghaiensis]
MKLRFLGTGSGVPSKERNVTAIVLDLTQERGTTWLFDCGEATQHQILKTTIRPRKIEKIFITHLHGDHIYGLPGLLSSRSFQDGTTPVTIYGPEGIEEYVIKSLEVSQTHLRYPLIFQKVDEGLLFEDDQFIVRCTKLDHGIDSFGYRIEEKNSTGELLPEKLQAIGLAPGPLYKEIKQNSTTTLPDGRIINRSDFIGPDKQGRTVTILGDTRYIGDLIDFIEESDVLVHESTFAADEEKMAYEYYHTTTRQAAHLALAGNVNTLLLTHISSRYQGEDIMDLEAEATAVFPNSKVVTDFLEWEIAQK